jgi:AcrR family transcriptional regulator
VLAAAVELLEARDFERLTMEGVARKAGVSKQTVYRWWPSPAAILMEALNELARVQVNEVDTGSLAEDLHVFIRSTVEGLRTGTGPLVATLMAKAQLNDEFGRTFRMQLLDRRRGALRLVLERAEARGEIEKGVDLDLLVDVAFGTIWYRLLAQHRPLDRRFSDQLTSALLELAAKES